MNASPHTLTTTSPTAASPSSAPSSATTATTVTVNHVNSTDATNSINNTNSNLNSNNYGCSNRNDDYINNNYGNGYEHYEHDISNATTTLAFDSVSPATAAKILGWRRTSIRRDNLCGGYYSQPAIVIQPSDPPAPGEATTTITATKSAFLAKHDVSVLMGDVTVTQPGRQITADKAEFFRDAKTEEINAGNLIGRVHLREYGKVIVSKDGHWDATSKLITLRNSIYRMLRPTAATTIDVWGKARKIVRDNAGVLTLSKATYTTCSPESNSWKLWGNKIVLDKNSGRGTATHAALLIKDIPVFYTPYINFPLDKKRKSGFLYPSFNYTNDAGLDVSLPYYFNLAPNYDATITPRIITRRGLFGQGEFRYLTTKSSGTLDLRYINNDQAFTNFQNESQTKYSPGYSLSRLTNASSNRGFIGYKNNTKFDQHWSSNININYASDDYFFQDFGNSPSNDQGQLFNQADISYAGETWSFAALTQAFQTLHPINQSPTAQDQYRRLPQFDIKGDFPNQKHGFDYQVNSEFVNFDYDHLYDPISKQLKATGSRINIIPSIALPLRLPGSYIKPKVQLHSTFYSLKNNLTPQNAMENNMQRIVPIASTDSGTYLSRGINLFGNSYTQTLEPRVFYLFVPNSNQENVPIFDSSLAAFNFDQLFATNRFSGYDLVGDANQVSAAITTRFLDSFTAEEKFNASIGQLYAFNMHKVCVNRNCAADPLAQNRMSPTVGQMQYNLTPNWSATASAAWDMNISKLNNAAFTVKYNSSANRIVSVSYNFVKDGDVTNIPNTSNNLNRINLAAAWPVMENWNVVANWNYNLSHNHPQEYFYGLEYQNCCWAFRVVQSRSFTGTDVQNTNIFKQAIYLQFMLKSLGSVGTSSSSSILTSQLPGYQDNFSGI